MDIISNNVERLHKLDIFKNSDFENFCMIYNTDSYGRIKIDVTMFLVTCNKFIVTI